MGAPKVKPLLWYKDEHNPRCKYAPSAIGIYMMTWEYAAGGPDGAPAYFTVRVNGVVLHSGWNEARAEYATQEFHDDRVLSALDL